MVAIKRFGFGKKKTMDMTQGSIAKNILVFALPLLVGNLFQQLYNLVDTYVADGGESRCVARLTDDVGINEIV